MSPTRRVIASAVVAIVALGSGACASNGSGSNGSGSTGATVTTTATAEPAPQEPGVGTSASEPSVQGEAEPNHDEDLLEVSVRGDEGVLGLHHSGPVPAGAPGPGSGRLITGPGGCFAFAGDRAPQLVVFPAEAMFVLQNGRPSVTVDGTEHFVGRELTVSTTAVSKAKVTGLPDRCSRGSSDTVLVVN